MDNVEVDTYDGLLAEYAKRFEHPSSSRACAPARTLRTSSRWRR